MICYEQPGQVDLLTQWTFSQIPEIMNNPELEFTEKRIMTDKLVMLGAVYCGTALGIRKRYDEKYDMTGTVLISDEENIPDGVYCYASPLGIDKLKEHDVAHHVGSRFEDCFTLYSSTDIDEQKIVIWYGDRMICTVQIINDGNQVIPHQVVPALDVLPDDATKKACEITQEALMEAIAMYNTTRMAGFKQGYKQAQEDIENGEIQM